MKAYKTLIINADTPARCAFLARQSAPQHRIWSAPLLAIIQQYKDAGVKPRSDWEEVKETVMIKILHAKFTQHNDLRQLLIETGDAILREFTTRDTYWGNGGVRNDGKNRLGVLLMELRNQLRKAKHGR